MQAQPNLYDAIGYRTFAQAQVHPDRLAALALLHGIEPVPVECCRVLEIGCGDGGNLVPMAAAFPGSRFFGFDLSAAAISRAQRFVGECGLRNITVWQADVIDPAAIQASFDYVLCHGVYSWVPAPAREAILQACQEHLSPAGLCFISYNALPGGHVRQAAREILRWHTRADADPAEQVRQARALATYLGGATGDSHAIGRALRAEFSAIAKKEDGFLLHDELNTDNTPFYLHEFIAAAARHQLWFVADAEPGNLRRWNPGGDAPPGLRAIPKDRLEREQYSDFATARCFRETILCRRELAVADEPDVDRLSRGWFSSVARVLTPEAIPLRGVEAAFQRPGGERLETSFLPGKLALMRLAELSPARTTYADLEGAVRQAMTELGCSSEWTQATPGDLRRFLLEAYAPKFVDFHAVNPPVASRPGEHPRAFPPARCQAAVGPRITNAYHQVIELQDRWSREALRRMDGSRSTNELHDELAEFARTNGAEQDPLWQEIHRDFEAALCRLARLGVIAE